MIHSQPQLSRSAHDSVPRIGRDELAAALAREHPPALFEVLPRGYWLKHHLPGALNAPPDQAASIITARVPDRGAEIVVYCWDPACPRGRQAARELAALGYTNVRTYDDGKADWIAAGLPMERPPR
jgi:rhodanese-related sulfurtransferase